MKNDERTTHPAGSLGPGARKHSNRHERHRQGNTIRAAISRRDWEDLDLDTADRPRPVRSRAFAEVL